MSDAQAYKPDEVIIKIYGDGILSYCKCQYAVYYINKSVRKKVQGM